MYVIDEFNGITNKNGTFNNVVDRKKSAILNTESPLSFIRVNMVAISLPQVVNFPELTGIKILYVK